MAEPTPTPAPPRRRGIPKIALLFLTLLLLGAGVSFYVYMERIYPIQQQLATLKVEAETFRNRPVAEALASLDPALGWNELLGGQARGKVARVQGRIGLKYQVLKGASGGTLFLFPPDAGTVEHGPRALLYFVEAEPPAPGSLVEAEVWVSQIDAQASVQTISPEQLGQLDASIPRAILIAARPLKVLDGPTPGLVPTPIPGPEQGRGR